MKKINNYMGLLFPGYLTQQQRSHCSFKAELCEVLNTQDNHGKFVGWQKVLRPERKEPFSLVLFPHALVSYLPRH